MAQCPTVYATWATRGIVFSIRDMHRALPYLKLHLFCGLEHGILRKANHREGRFIQILKASSMHASLAFCVGPRMQRTCVAASKTTQCSTAKTRYQLSTAWAHADTARTNAKPPTPVISSGMHQYTHRQ